MGHVKNRNVKTLRPFLFHKKPIRLSRNEFNFFDHSADIDQIGWNPKKYEKLWIYNLHYFDCLNDSSSTKSNFKDDLYIIHKWINENVNFHGVGWDPYPTSLRIVNWVKWSINNNYIDEKIMKSINLQTEWLFKRMEWHLLGNHLFANAKALLFSYFFLDGKNSDKWLTLGLEILTKELQEQILADGGNFELSPMYHGIFLEDLLDIINISSSGLNFLNADKVNELKKYSKKMIDWMNVMSHDDGQISFFNDSAFGISPTVKQLTKYAKSFGIEISSGVDHFIHLKDSGYIKLKNDNVSSILDVGKIGPDYLPGHAHADSLAFELSYKNNRIFVNGCTSTYEIGKKRIKQRSTLSHNTVEINNKNSSDIWSSFRVGKRAKTFDLKINHKIGCSSVSCSHDGYTSFKNSIIHNREWTLKENNFQIIDKISGRYNSATGTYILHPNVKIIKNNSKNYLLLLPDGTELGLDISSESNLIDFSFYEYFGCNEIKTNAIRVNILSGYNICTLKWKN